MTVSSESSQHKYALKALILAGMKKSSREDAKEMRMLSPVNNEMTLVCNGEHTFTCSSTLYTVSKLLERVVQQKKGVMSRGKGSFMDVETKEGGRDVTSYGHPPSLLPTTTTDITTSNSYRVKNILNKRHLRGPSLPTMEKAALGARSRYSPMN